VTRILPSISYLSSVPIERRHAPVTTAEHGRGYERFRNCLRWEFWFSCSFCLLHETQVSAHGASGSAQFWIEHLEPQSDRPELRNVYGNVVYACRRYNVARQARPRIDARGRRLLDPCADVWAAQFCHDGDELRALTPDAAYTSEAYDINAPTKIALRRGRREAIQESLHTLGTVPDLLERMMAGVDLRSGDDQQTWLEIAEQLHKALAAARRTLLQLSAVPHDANVDCACDRGACSLPGPVAAGLLHLAFEPGRH
jgi:hypothetical protein